MSREWEPPAQAYSTDTLRRFLPGAEVTVDPNSAAWWVEVPGKFRKLVPFSVVTTGRFTQGRVVDAVADVICDTTWNWDRAAVIYDLTTPRPARPEPRFVSDGVIKAKLMKSGV